MKQTFSKAERLHEKKLIARLFKNGKSFFIFPFRVVYDVMEETSSCPARVLVSVSKRHFKKAVDRNRIKRLVREAYRRNKSILDVSMTKGAGCKTILLGLIYVSKEHMEYNELEKKIILILQQLKKHEQATR